MITFYWRETRKVKLSVSSGTLRYCSSNKNVEIFDHQNGRTSWRELESAKRLPLFETFANYSRSLRKAVFDASRRSIQRIECILELSSFFWATDRQSHLLSSFHEYTNLRLSGFRISSYAKLWNLFNVRHAHTRKSPRLKLSVGYQIQPERLLPSEDEYLTLTISMRNIKQRNLQSNRCTWCATKEFNSNLHAIKKM